jgi:hypothetical protein
MTLKVGLDLNLVFLVYERFSLWVLNSFSFSPLGLQETEQLSHGQKVEFSEGPFNHSENSRAIGETGARRSERGIIVNFTPMSRIIFSGHSDREGPTSRVRGSKNSFGATRPRSPRTLLERNFWLFPATLPSWTCMAFGAKERKFLSNRLRYQWNVMAIAQVGTRERISGRNREPSNILKSTYSANLDTHIWNWF